MKKVDRSDGRTATKKCPDCDLQCPVALRACTCGYSFTRTRPVRNKVPRQLPGTSTAPQTTTKSGKASTSDAGENLDKEGRRIRTKRMRPDYYNSLELEYASRSYKTRKPKEDKEKAGKKRGRPKGSTGIPRRSKEEKRREQEEANKLPELDDLYANFPPERMRQFSFILDEINFKMSSQIFKPL